jgi:hypothetical protein
LRQEGLNAFPGDYLDSDSEVNKYSRYVTDAVSAYEGAISGTYESDPPVFTLPADMSPEVEFPASSYSNATSFATGGTTEQQLRSRGIYMDYMTDVLRARINCLDDGGSGVDCDVPDVTTALEAIPFYDVQLTMLSRWNESPNNNPIDVTNESISNGGYNRGTATLEAGFGPSTITSASHKGNLGLTGTDPIDPYYSANEAIYSLYAFATDFSTPPPVSSDKVSGTITSSVGGVKASDVSIKASGAQCDRTSTGFECNLEIGAENPRLTVSNYFKSIKVLVACSPVLELHGQEHIASNGYGNWTRFNLPGGAVSNANIVIRLDSCD